MKHPGQRRLVCLSLLVLLVLEMPTIVLGSSPLPSSSLTVRRRLDGLVLSIGEVQVALQPSMDPSMGKQLGFRAGNDARPATAAWNYTGGLVDVILTYVPRGVFVNLRIRFVNDCSCRTDAAVTLQLSGLREDLESIILSTTPLTQIAPPAETETLIGSMDYRTVDRLYGVAAAFVSKSSNTFEVVSLYPFASISYNPRQNDIGLVFKNGRGDLSTSAFESGDTTDIVFYLGAANARQTTDSAFLSFAGDAEAAFPRRDFGKPFILYGVDGGSWDDVRREAESFGYTLVYSDYTWEYTSLRGGGHYFGLGWETMDRLKQAGLESALVRGTDGNPIGNGIDFRVNPSDPGLQGLIRKQIDNHVASRNWFIADGVDIIQDFDTQHTNILVGYMQALLYVRSTGRGIMYNPWHAPRLWLDWISDAVEIEGPTGLFSRGDGTRADYVASGEFFGVTREFIRLHSTFFPKRTIVWHDFVNLDDSSVTDSIAFALMEGTGSYSFSTSKSGSVKVKPGDITTVVRLLAKMDSARLLRLGRVQAQFFAYSDTQRGWAFEALSRGSVRWLGVLDRVLAGDTPIQVNFDGLYSAFDVAPSHIVLVPTSQ